MDWKKSILTAVANDKKVFAEPAGPFKITNGISSDDAINAFNANFCDEFFGTIPQGFRFLESTETRKPSWNMLLQEMEIFTVFAKAKQLK